MGERVDAYSIDRADRVASVSDSWLEFARANRAPELTRGHVLGESIWRFIAGTETRRLYEDLFLRVRTRAESVEFPFRCDSPDRFMRLSLEAGPQGSILCRGITVREQERPFFSILDRAFPRNASSLSMCSFCKRIYAFDAQWLDAEDAIGQLELFDSATLPRIEYAVCDACSSVRRGTPDGAVAV